MKIIRKIIVLVAVFTVLLAWSVKSYFIQIPTKITFNVTGQYLDKKFNPIGNADIEAIHEGMIVGASETNANGDFITTVLITGEEDNFVDYVQEDLLELKGANPFKYTTKFESTIKYDATARIVSMNGQIVDQVPLQGSGTHKFSWGGQTQNGHSVEAGNYILNIVSPFASESIQLIYIGNQGTSGLQLENYESIPEDQIIPWKNTMSEIDTLRFTKEYTTELLFPFEHEEEDINLGQILGNVGPEETNEIENVGGNVGDLFSWYLPDEHVYNDEESNDYFTESPGTWVSNDTLYHEIQETTTQVELQVKDLTDPSLEILLQFTGTPDASNQPPEAFDDEYNIDEEETIEADVLLNDFDPDGNLDPTSVEITEQPQNGQILGINPTTGEITYKPDTLWFGTDTFEYKVYDTEDLWDAATVTMYVASVNNYPIANDDYANTEYETSTTIDVVANDTDPDGEIDPTTVSTDGVQQPSNGTIPGINPTTGAIEYQPNDEFSGEDSFEYVVWDNGTPSLSDTAMVYVQIAEQGNQAPIANDDIANGYEDITLTIDVLANDEDPDGNLDPTSVETGNGLQEPQHGTILGIDPTTGAIEYIGDEDSSETDSFEYKVYDTEGLWSVATVTVNLEAINDAPELINNIPNQSNPEDINLILNLADYFGDIDSDLINPNIQGLPVGWTQSWNGMEGTITAPQNYNGTITELIATVSDEEYTTESNDFNITKTPVNDAPELINNVPNQTNPEDINLIINAENYFSDVDSDMDFELEGLPGGWSQNWNDEIGTITAPSDYNGTITEIILKASDEEHTTESNEFNITKTPVNDAPYEVSVIGPQTIQQNGSLILTVRPTNVDDIDSPTLDYELENVVNATWSHNGDEITITPTQGYNGTIENIIIKADDGEYEIPVAS